MFLLLFSLFVLFFSSLRFVNRSRFAYIYRIVSCVFARAYALTFSSAQLSSVQIISLSFGQFLFILCSRNIKSHLFNWSSVSRVFHSFAWMLMRQFTFKVMTLRIDSGCFGCWWHFQRLNFKTNSCDEIVSCKLMFTRANSAQTEKKMIDCLEYLHFIELSQYPELK